MQGHEESKQQHAAAASVIKGAAVVSSRMKPSMLKKIKKKCAIRRLGPNKLEEVRDDGDGRCSNTDADSRDESCQSASNNIALKKDEKEKKKSDAGSSGYVEAHTRKRLYDEQVSQRNLITNAIVNLDDNLMNLFGQDDDNLGTELEHAEEDAWNACHEKCRKFLYNQKRDHLLDRDEGFRKWLSLQEEDVKAGKGMSEEKIYNLRLLLTPTSTEMKRRYDELNESGNAGVDEDMDAFLQSEQEEFRVNLQEMKKKGKNHYVVYRRIAKILAELRPSMPPPENEEKRRKGFLKFGLKRGGNDYNDEESDGLITYDASTLSGSTNLSIEVEGNRNEEEEKKGLKSFSLFGRGDEVPDFVYISTNITVWQQLCCASRELFDDVVVGLGSFSSKE